MYDKNIDFNQIIEISGIVPEEFIKNLMKKIYEGDLDNLLKEVDNVLYEGYSPN